MCVLDRWLALLILFPHREHGDNSSYLTYRRHCLFSSCPIRPLPGQAQDERVDKVPPQPVWENEDASSQNSKGKNRHILYNTRLQDSSSWRLAVTIITFCNKVRVGSSSRSCFSKLGHGPAAKYPLAVGQKCRFLGPKDLQTYSRSTELEPVFNKILR